MACSTFVRNQAAYGGGVAMRASKGSVYSCNLTANTATTKGGGIVRIGFDTASQRVTAKAQRLSPSVACLHV